MVLMRDEVSQALMIVDANKVSSVNKVSKLTPGVTIKWQGNSRERWRGPILAIGTESECSNAMKIIEKNSGSKNSGTIKSKRQPLQSTITVEAKKSLRSTKPVETKKPLRSRKIMEENQSEIAQVNEDEDEDEEIKIDEDEEVQMDENEEVQTDEDEEVQADEEVQTDEDEEVQVNEDEEVQINEDEEDDDDSLLYIAAEEEKNSNTSLITPLDTSILSTSSRSEKRPHEESDTNSKINKKKRSTGSVGVPFSVYSAKEKECMLLTARVADFEQNWMPRPKDPKVIQYLIEITNILSGNKNEDDEVDKGKVLEDIMKELKMSEDDLSMCHSATATKTARHIMKHTYPNPSKDSTISNIGESFILAVIKYTHISNPTDRTPEVEIRHAMGNHLAVQKFKHKMNQNISSKHVTDEAHKKS